MNANSFSKDFNVKNCCSCPFFEVIDMEHIMRCGHPYWKDKGAYAGCIITQETRNTIPPKCPLRQGEVVIIKTVKLQ